MKKMNSKGFTLVELLAVITIMGVLMIVAIPAVSRTIENTRRDTFANTANQYANAVKNAVSADELLCNLAGSATQDTKISAADAGTYYVNFSSGASTTYLTTQQDLIEQGGKSAWGNADVKGYVEITKTVNTTTNKSTYTYKVVMVDSGNRGITTATENPKRNDVKMSGGNYGSFAFKAASTSVRACKIDQ